MDKRKGAASATPSTTTKVQSLPLFSKDEAEKNTEKNVNILANILEVINKDVAFVEEEAKEEKDRYRIDLTATYSEPSFLIEADGIGTLPKGDIIAIKAKSKQGKTFVASIFAAVVLGATFGSLRSREKGGKVVLIDTEQNRANTAKVAMRIHSLTGLPIDKNSDQLSVYALRQMDMEKRYPFIVERVKEEHPTLLVVDGIADLIRDFNAITESQEIISNFMQLSAENDMAVAFILHTNKGADDNNMKGHLGTMAVQKCSDVFSVTKNGCTFSVTETECRNRPIGDFSFVLDYDGIPHYAPLTPTLPPPSKEEHERKIFAEILTDGEIGHNDLVRAYMKKKAVKSDKTAKTHIEKALRMGMIRKTDTGKYAKG